MLTPMVLPCLEEAAAKADTPFLGNVIAQLEMARAAAAGERSVMLTGHGGDYAFQGNLHNLEQAFLQGREPLAAWWAARLAVRYRRYGGVHRWLKRRFGSRHGSSQPSNDRGDGLTVSDDLSPDVRTLWGAPDSSLSEPGRLSILEGLAIERAGWHITPFEQVGAAFGVDVRHPFFDLDLFEAALSIPQMLHLARGFHKGLLRMAAGPQLPELVRTRRCNRLLSGFLNDGFSLAARDQPRDEFCSGLSTKIEGGLKSIASGFEMEMLVPLQLLTVDLKRRSRRG
jgi:asparagine synthetase B (glutamine-hydrolysing)